LVLQSLLCLLGLVLLLQHLLLVQHLCPQVGIQRCLWGCVPPWPPTTSLVSGHFVLTVIYKIKLARLNQE
jgi:hypothetical protein